MMRHILGESELANATRFVVANVDTDEFIGFCGLKHIDSVADFGYFIRSKFWCNGIAVKACELAINKLSSVIDLATVQVFIAEENLASQRVAQNWVGGFLTVVLIRKKMAATIKLPPNLLPS
ncbi:GNAT family N-acetyltransferase [Vreelandella sp.]|uniref:GNAT family N-acetyltransferase n=1 Tax=Vreelandella sp. TaxID=3137778 RepID=UPI003BA8B3F0